MKRYFWTIAAMAFVLCALICAAPANAAETPVYPSKPVTLVVGNAAGGGSDISARILAKHIRNYFSQPVVVVNNPVGSGEAAFLEVARAAPDGYTLGFFHAGQVMATAMRQTKYDLKNYKYVAKQTNEPRILVVRKNDARFPDIGAFIAYAKEHPEEVTVGDSGAGSSEHFNTEAICFYGGVKLVPVHTNGSAETKVALLGEHIDACSMALSEAVGMVADDQATILAISSEKRRSEFPDVPTFMESGINYTLDVFRGIYAPKDTPQETVDLFSAAVEKVSKDPAYIEEMSKLTLPASYENSEQFTATVQATKAFFDQFIKDIGYKQQ